METKNQLTTQQQNLSLSLDFIDTNQYESMMRVSSMLANSDLVPDMYRTSQNNPESKATANCMIALSIAKRIGADPLMVMQNLVIIYGRPSWSSKFLIATVNSYGRFKPLQYRFTEKGMLGKVNYIEYVWNPQTRAKQAVQKTFDGTQIMDIECVAYTTTKKSNEVLESAPVSIRMAIQEGWYTKNGSKWQTMPKQMLMYRSASFWTNVHAPEISMGMKTEDEIRDIIDIDYEEKSQRAAEKEEKIKENIDLVGFNVQDVSESEPENSVEPEDAPELEIVPEPEANPMPESKPEPIFKSEDKKIIKESNKDTKLFSEDKDKKLF